MFFFRKKMNFIERKILMNIRVVVNPLKVSIISHFWSTQFQTNAWLGARDVVRISGLLTPDIKGRRKPYGDGILLLIYIYIFK